MARLTQGQVITKLLHIKHLRSKVSNIQAEIDKHEADLLEELVHLEREIEADARARGHDTLPVRMMVVSEGNLR